MEKRTVFITDYGFENLYPERRVLESLGYEIIAAQCKNADDVTKGAKHADALLVQWAPLPASVIRELENCKIIVRYGIGVDNVDLAAAKQCGIAVCNVPDYCIDEVADHTLSMVLALVRQLKTTEARMRSETWSIKPPEPMPPCREMIFATAGFGRIAREVIVRATPFKFKFISYDPYVPAEAIQAFGVKKVTKEELFKEADVLSLHLPLNADTSEFINRETLEQMKPSAFVINTSRGGLINTTDLANSLQAKRIGGAGLDVFESEPLPPEHPMWNCPNTVLTSHTAWYSLQSSALLQQRAAEEVARGLAGAPLLNRVI